MDLETVLRLFSKHWRCFLPLEMKELTFLKKEGCE